MSDTIDNKEAKFKIAILMGAKVPLMMLIIINKPSLSMDVFRIMLVVPDEEMKDEMMAVSVLLACSCSSGSYSCAMRMLLCDVEQG